MKLVQRRHGVHFLLIALLGSGCVSKANLLADGAAPDGRADGAALVDTSVEPDKGTIEPDKGVIEPDKGAVEPDKGVIEPDKGIQPDQGVVVNRYGQECDGSSVVCKDGLFCAIDADFFPGGFCMQGCEVQDHCPLETTCITLGAVVKAGGGVDPGVCLPNCDVAKPGTCRDAYSCVEFTEPTAQLCLGRAP